MSVTGLSFGVAAPLLSLAVSAVAVVLLYGMLRETADRFTARAAILAFGAFVTAPVLQLDYTEGSAALVIVLALLALRRGRTGWLLVASLALALTRPITPALALVVAAYAVLAWRRDREAPTAQRRLLIGLATAGLIGAMAGIWPAIAAAVTGRLDAYPATMAAWTVYQGAPVGHWFAGVNDVLGVSGVVLLVTVLVIVLLLPLRRSAAAWGPELRLWAFFYPLYLALMTAPNSSILRYALLALVPFWLLPNPRGVPVSRRDARIRWVVLGVLLLVGVLAQQWWLSTVFTVRSDPALQLYP